MFNKTPEISQLGERSILLQWEFGIDTEKVFWLLDLKEVLSKLLLKQKVEIVNTYDSLLVKCVFDIDNVYNVKSSLLSFDFESLFPKNIERNIYKIPVCYDDHFALDLELISEEKQLQKQQIISLHSDPVYTICFMGFLPGFAYLSGMKNELSFPRKRSPRESVLKGAVGIAGNQTGMYPNASPGGWQIIGNCPLNFFDAKREDPSLFKAGDQLKFYPISREEHEEIKLLSDSGVYQLETLQNG